MFKPEEFIQVKMCKEVFWRCGKSARVTWSSWFWSIFELQRLWGLQNPYLLTFLKTSSSANTGNTLIPSSSFTLLLGIIILEDVTPTERLSCDFLTAGAFIQNPFTSVFNVYYFKSWQIFLVLLIFIILWIYLWSIFLCVYGRDLRIWERRLSTVCIL